MKNILLSMLFMLSFSFEYKQEKPSNDTIKTPVKVYNTYIDTSAYNLPETTPLDGVIEEIKDLKSVVKKTQQKALQVERNAKRYHLQRKNDTINKTLDALYRLDEINNKVER